MGKIELSETAEAITAVIPVAREHRPYFAGNFVSLVDNDGIRIACMACSRMSDDRYVSLELQNEWAQRHWTEKHT